MDKNTLGNYGWVVITVIIISIMIALASPFAVALKGNVVGVTNDFTGRLDDALDGISSGADSSDEEEGSGGSNLPAGGEVDAETGEILDSWEVIINNVNNGTYVTKYAVGNYKPLDLGNEGVVNMQIAAIDADDMTSGGKAHITWIAKELLATKHNMKNADTDANSWKDSEMRTYLQTDIWALINPTVQNAIVAVDKTYNDKATGSTKTCSDKVWIPSWREVGFADGKEDSGVVYSELFTNDASRVKYLSGTATRWWLRSVNTDYSGIFCLVLNDGDWGSLSGTFTYGIALSFCF